MDWTEIINELKKKHQLTNDQLGEYLGKSGDAFRKSLKRNSFNQLESNALIKLIEMDKNPNFDMSNEIDHIISDQKNDDIVSEPEAIWVNYDRFMMVPLVGQRAQAGFLSGWGDPEYIDELPKVPWEVDKEYKGKYVCFEVAGDSMDDNSQRAILERDILLCREVQRHHWRPKLHINKWNFVIVHKFEGVLVKRITKQTEDGYLTLHSLNELYDDQVIHLNDVIAIFNVVDLHRKPII